MVSLQSARVKVQIVGQPVLIDAVQKGKHGDVLSVQFTGPGDAVISGVWNGTPFTVTAHDGGKDANKLDTVRVVYGSFDTSTLTARHANVHIDRG